MPVKDLVENREIQVRQSDDPGHFLLCAGRYTDRCTFLHLHCNPVQPGDSLFSCAIRYSYSISGSSGDGRDDHAGADASRQRIKAKCLIMLKYTVFIDLGYHRQAGTKKPVTQVTGFIFFAGNVIPWVCSQCSFFRYIIISA